MRLIGTSINVVDQSAASPATSMFRSSRTMRRAARSSVLASDINTLVIYSWYSKHSPAASCNRGVFVSATWGRIISAVFFVKPSGGFLSFPRVKR
jgi:hypothetical protein